VNEADTILIQNFWSDESEMEDEVPHITLGGYERLDNLDEVSLEFQHVNPMVFDINNCVLNSLKRLRLFVLVWY